MSMSTSMSTVDFYSASPHPPLMRYMLSFSLSLFLLFTTIITTLILQITWESGIRMSNHSGFATTRDDGRPEQW